MDAPLGLLAKLKLQGQAVRHLGTPQWLHYRLQTLRLRRAPRGRRFRLTSRYAQHPLQCRAQTSDLAVFYQIFIHREYACLDQVANAGLILDCGANVGYSSAYFLSRFPQSQVIAVEPDPDNFDVLRANLAPYGSRASSLQAAIWSHPASLALSTTPYRSGAEWSRQVRECEVDEAGSLPAVDIGTLLQESGHERISILKMDIEGAEAVVFAGDCDDWIDRVDHLVIELHDDSHFGPATEIFQQVAARQGWELSESGELTVCRRR